MNVPWSQPEITAKDKKSINRVLESGWLGEGKETKDFEKAICNYIGCRNAVLFNSATSALTAALLVNNLSGNQKTVMVPANTFIATVNTPLELGSKVILADCDRKTHNITPQTMLKTKLDSVCGIMPVDVAGNPIDIEPIEKICSEKKIVLIEDAAEAFGAEYNGKKIGSFDHTTVFSFHMAKLITTIEGGCITTNDDEIAKEFRRIKFFGSDHSFSKTFFHFFGLNFKTTDVQAALGLSQLERIEKFIKHRNKLAKIYYEELSKIPEIGFQEIPDFVTKAPYMLFNVVFPKEKRDNVLKYLNENDIATRICFIPAYKHPYHSKIFPDTILPNSENIGETTIALPIGNGLKEEQIQFVCDKVKEAMKCR